MRSRIPARPAVSLLLALGLGALVGTVACRSTDSSTAGDLAQLKRDSLDLWAAALGDTVEDPLRRDRALRVLETYHREEERFLERMRVVRERGATVNADPGAVRGDFDGVLEEARGARHAYGRAVQELVFDLRGLLTRDEWVQVLSTTAEVDARWEALLR